MMRLLIAALSAAVLGMGVAVVTGAGATGADDTTTVGTTETVTDTATTTETTPTTEDNPARAGDDRAAREAGEDISGPCDEAEHANDPRCTGAPTGARADDDHGDRSSPSGNSGHGGNSGPGSGHEDDDDGDDDHSGRGRGGDDD